MNIHPTAIIHPKAELDDDVVVGPYSVIGEHVRIGQGTQVGPHVCIEGWTDIGRQCRISSFASIGAPPQHLQYQDEPTHVLIGDHNIIREYVTINRGTSFGGGHTTLGHHNFLMAYVHIAHDCQLGNHIIMANAATLAGHITLGSYTVIGGLVGIHQYVRVGDYAMVGGCSAVGKDVPPFVRAVGGAGGYRAKLFGVNALGLRRHGFSKDQIGSLKSAYDLLFRKGYRVTEAAKLARNMFPHSQDVLSLVTFLESSTRGICRSIGKNIKEYES
ncbi:MAG: acyl-ACP--UDP-N-acetylglucosamine O-acyltransferase [Nitrospirales bacterium]|nr:acyl-ACP--UDP-N-acetylglucosamine O-acyltransferase [Nitrospirales bacterium]